MFTTDYKVSFSDTDPGGILFYGEIFNIAHIAYELFFESMNLEKNYFIDHLFAIPIVHAEADYLSPAKFGDKLKIQLTVSEVGKSSFELKYKITSSQKPIAKIKTNHVVVSKNNFTSVDIPENLREGLIKNLD